MIKAFIHDGFKEIAGLHYSGQPEELIYQKLYEIDQILDFELRKAFRLKTSFIVDRIERSSDKRAVFRLSELTSQPDHLRLR